MRAEEAEAQFWLIVRFFPAVPFMPLLVSLTPWFAFLPLGGLYLALTSKEAEWLLKRSRATFFWFWATYVGSCATVAAHALLGPSAKFAINAFAVPFFVASLLCLGVLWVSRWVGLAEAFGSEAVERLAEARRSQQRQTPSP